MLSRSTSPDPATAARNAAAHAALAADLAEQLRTVALGGGARARERHVSRGKLLPRERVDALEVLIELAMVIVLFAVPDIILWLPSMAVE